MKLEESWQNRLPLVGGFVVLEENLQFVTPHAAPSLARGEGAGPNATQISITQL